VSSGPLCAAIAFNRLLRLGSTIHRGVTEISWKCGDKYLTIVIDQDPGNFIWGVTGRAALTIPRFIEDLGLDETQPRRSGPSPLERPLTTPNARQDRPFCCEGPVVRARLGLATGIASAVGQVVA
jgi:hypothetical protein